MATAIGASSLTANAKPARVSAAPVLSSAPPNGIVAPNSTTIGQSMFSYNSRRAITLVNTIMPAAMVKATGALRIFIAVRVMAPAKINNGRQMFFGVPIRILRCASGKQPKRRKISSKTSALPCSSNTSPGLKRTLDKLGVNVCPSRATAKTLTPKR
ncbi:MAG: Uncharacterised protein [Pseudidiomarina mangrovi]|nr:MAG: Uncharacterised protein [Pseudidiomarina mangrovi]